MLASYLRTLCEHSAVLYSTVLYCTGQVVVARRLCCLRLLSWHHATTPRLKLLRLLSRIYSFVVSD